MERPAPPRLRLRLKIIAVLFTLTGAVALLLEQAFEKMLSTLLGCSTPAAATVLGVYFAGLGLGGLAYGLLIRPHASQPILIYACLEGGIGLCALLMYLFFDDLIPVFVPLLSLGFNNFWLLQFLRMLVAVCWIMPLTFLMGASFPAIVDALEILRVPHRGRAMSKFYMINLLGGLIGVFIGLYVIFPRFGVDGALLAACLINSVACFTAILLAQGMKTRSTAYDLEENLAPIMGPSGLRYSSMLLVVAFVSGFLFFALEVLWTHLIAAVMGNSIYAFGTMLATVLLGLGVGAAVASLSSPSPKTQTLPALTNLVLSGAIILTLFYGLWPLAPIFFLAVGGSAHTFLQGEIIRWLLALFMLLPAAVILGMIYPALFRLDIFPNEQRGAVAGQLGAMNAAGCILGALVCGFLLIPYLGSEGSMRFLIALLGLCGLALCLVYLRGRARLVRILISLTTLLVVVWQDPWNRLILTSGVHVYFSPGYVLPHTNLLFFHEDTYGGMTTVVENRQSQVVRTLLTNGKFQGNDSSEMAAQVGFALVPMMFVSAFDDALVIGLGTGHSAHIIETMGFKSIDVAEIAPGIVQGARQFFPHINGGVVDRPNVHLILEDGRNVLLLRQKQYDLITMEISSLWFAGSTNLYSSEFYALVKRRLKPGGVFQQWVQLHHIGTDELLNEISTLRHVFPCVSLWVLGRQGILVASEREQIIQPGFLRQLEAHRDILSQDAITLPGRFQTMLASRLLAPGDVTRIAASYGALNTDRNRALEYASPRYNLSRVDHYRDNLLALGRWASFPPPELAAPGAGVLWEAVRQVTRRDYFHSLGLPGPP
jgi:spermidine synthase